MPLLEQYIIDPDGRKRVIFEDTEAVERDVYADYLTQCEKATTPQQIGECNRELMKQIRARYPL